MADTPVSTIVKLSKPRCAMCHKKLGLVNFTCKCGGLYCTQHRGDVDHQCTYDYKAEQQKSLSTLMEKVVAKKVEVL